jgi:Protein of unknown function (DUF3047)
MRRVFNLVFALTALLATSTSATAADPLLTPFGTDGGTPAAPWHVSGLPNQKKPYTKFSMVDLEGKRALRIESQEAYGNLVHTLALDGPARHLAWKWRVDELIDAVDLRVKAGDDTAVKVCVFFDHPLEQIPFGERQLLRIARSQTTEPLPGATVCYVWDANLPVGTAIDNAFTRRMRYIVLQSGSANLRQWKSERRDVAADFLKLFADESTKVPPITGVAVGADSDNTHSHSLAHVMDMVLEP